MEKPKKVRIEDIAIFHLGNGYIVCDRSRIENGDYPKIAHIDRYRVVTWFAHIDKKAVAHVFQIAQDDEGCVSATQNDKVLVSKAIIRAMHKRHEELEALHPNAINLLGKGDLWEIIGEKAKRVSRLFGRPYRQRMIDGKVVAVFTMSALAEYNIQRLRPGQDVTTSFLTLSEQWGSPIIRQKTV